MSLSPAKKMVQVVVRYLGNIPRRVWNTPQERGLWKEGLCGKCQRAKGTIGSLCQVGCFIRAAIPLCGTYAIIYRSSHEPTQYREYWGFSIPVEGPRRRIPVWYRQRSSNDAISISWILVFPPHHPPAFFNPQVIERGWSYRKRTPSRMAHQGW